MAAPNATVDTLAADFAVSKKTVLRILNGETWNDVTGFERPTKQVQKDPYPLRVMEALRNHDRSILTTYFGFLENATIGWAICDAWDGLTYVATDGHIAWKSKELCEFVQSIGGDELPSLGALGIISRSIGQHIDPKRIDPRFAQVAAQHKLKVRAAIGVTEFVYLTRSISCVTEHDFSTIAAAVELKNE